MKKRIGLFVFLSFIGMQTIFAQTVTINGRVTDVADNAPLPGVSVRIKGSSVGVATDIDGKYTLPVNRQDVLEFSFVGMETVEVPVGDKNVIDVQMKAVSLKMEEVVVTAQGMTRQQKALGYSVQNLKSEELMQTRQMDLNNALVGKVAGVRFWGSSGATFDAGKIVLRGTSSLNAGGSEPIYVVDGVITSANSINMDDVESVNVLKGPAATALYGSRGGDGAIIIKTKGLKGQRMAINLSHTLAFEKVYLHGDYQNEYGGGNLGAMAEMYTFKYDPSKHPAYLSVMDGAPYYDYASDVSWGPRMDGRMYAPWYAWDPTHPKFGQLARFSPPPKDNLEELFQTGMINTTNVSIAHSGKNYMSRVSFTNISRKGIMPNSDAARRFLSIKTNFKASERLNIALDYKYSYRRNHNNAQEGYGNTGNAFYTFTQWFHRNVDVRDLKDYKRPDGTFRSWNINSPTNLKPTYHNNPFAIFYEENWQSVYQWNVFSADASYEILSNLKAGIRVNGNLRNYNSYTAIPMNLLGETSRYSTSQNSLIDMQIQGRVTWSDQFFANKLALDAAFFLENRNYRYESVGAFTRDGLIIDKFFNVSASSGLPGGENSKTRMKERSVYGTVTAGWDNTYYLDLSLRNDWSSTLPKDKNSYLYGGVSASVIASNWLKSEWLSFWKLRASVAQVGKSTSAYNISEVYTTTKYGQLTAMRHDDRMKDPNIKPTISTAYEIGTEFRLFKDRIWGDFNFYNRDAKNQIINIGLTPASGYSSRTINAGKIRNRGVELAIGGSVVKTKDWIWDLNFNIARNVNTLIELDGNLKTYNWAWLSYSTRLYLVAEVGQPIGVIQGSVWEKDGQGNKILRKRSNEGHPYGDYTLNTVNNAKEKLGNVQPDATGGFSTSLRYKNLAFGASFDYQIGGNVASVSNMFGEMAGLLETTVGKNDRGVDIRMPLEQNGGIKVEGVVKNPDGTYSPVSTHVAANYYFDKKGSIWEDYVYDASYLKLREISLTYTVPVSLLKRLGGGIKSASLSFVAQNPWLIYSGMPNVDVSEVGNAYNSYIEQGQVASTRSFGFTIDMTF